MKNLNLNAMGVVEMKENEVKNIDGGVAVYIDGLRVYGPITLYEDDILRWETDYVELVLP